MSILKHLQTSLPNPEQTGIGEHATTTANTEVSKQLKLTGGKKRKAYTAFSDEDRAKMCCREWKQQCAGKNLSNRINKNAYYFIMKHSQNIFDA